MAEHILRASDAELVRLALAGPPDDQRAFDELYRRYRKQVASKAQRVLDDWEMLADSGMLDSVISRTFTNAFLKLHKFDTKRSFGAWLGTIARNAARNRLEQEEKHASVMQREHHWLTDVSNPPVPADYTHLKVSDSRQSPFEHAVSREQVERLRRALPHLKPAHREVVLLLMEDLGQKEIAARLGVGLSTAASRIRRAKKELKKVWKEMYGKEGHRT
jgi:RNA polymerase sigma factor CnrH